MNVKESVRLTVSVLLVVLVSLTGSGTASAASFDGASGTSGWAIQPLPTLTTAPNGHLSAVSCRSAGSCAAVGYSHDAQGVDVTLAEQWDGNRWTIQHTPNPDGAHDSFLTGVSCSRLPACTAVGDAVGASGQQVALAERWNGSRWELQRIPNPTGSETFLTSVSCVSPTACAAVGYGRIGARTTTIAERWDGTDWHLQATPNIKGVNSSRLSSVSCSAASACTAVGFSGELFGDPQAVAERWDGMSWSLQANPAHLGATRTALSSVSCPSHASCVATGYWHDNAKGGGTLAEHWDGSTWTIEPTPGGLTAKYTAVSCTTPNACLVVGKSDLSDFVTARWDGASWTSTTAPPTDTFIGTDYLGLSCGSTVNACVAVGAAQTARFDFTYVALAAAWDGSSWTLQTTTSPSGATANELVAVSCATERSCVAVGYQYISPDARQPLVEHWNGAGWRVRTTPEVPGSSLSAVSCSAVNDCVAVGSYTDGNDNFAGLAEHFDGTSWRVEPTPVPAGSKTAGFFTGVSCVRTGGDGALGRLGSPGSCVAVGAYADAAGQEVMLAEDRTGSTWAARTLPTPDGTTASALNAVSCLTPTDCTAVGAFQTGSLDPFGTPPGPCSYSCDLSEHWNGTDWQVQEPAAPPAALSDSLASVSCSAPAACVAAGQWTPRDRAGGHPGITLAEYWNGTGWAVQATGDPPGVGGPDGTSNSPFEAVSCVVGADICTAVGNYDGSDDGFQPLAERWSRGQWTVQTMPAPLDSYYNDVRGVSCPTVDMCMAVGMSYRYNVADLSPGPHVSLAELYRDRR